MGRVRSFVAFAAGILLCLVGTDVLADSFWSRAVESYDAGTGLNPGLMKIDSTEYDGRGSVRNAESAVYSLTWTGGDPEVRILSVIRNGADITSERRANPEYQSGRPIDGAAGGFGASPLDPTLQDTVTTTFTGIETIDGRRARAYRFGVAAESGAITGTAWIDAETGFPIRIAGRPDPLPRFVDVFEFRHEFGIGGNGAAVTSRITVDASGRLLLIRRRFVVTMEFSEHRP